MWDFAYLVFCWQVNSGQHKAVWQVPGTVLMQVTEGNLVKNNHEVIGCGFWERKKGKPQNNSGWLQEGQL